MSDIACPHCGQTGIPLAETGGGIVDCPGCDRAFVCPAPGQPELQSLPDPSATSGSEISGPASGTASPTDVSLPASAPIAGGATVLFFLLLTTPLGNTYFGQLFSARGWVPYVIAFFSLWATVILVQKYRLHREQSRIPLLDLLPHSFGQEINTNNAPMFHSYLQHLSSLGPRSYLVDRLTWGLRRFMLRRNIYELSQQLAERTRADSDAIDSSYSMLRVFVWAIPILGFIGTVLGISEAVASFSYSVNSAASLEVMRDSIGSVTTGLGVAFDTTLLALIMSILIMFPMSSLQKAEEDLLARSEEYCDRQLIGRLREAAELNPGNEIPRESERSRMLAEIEQLERRIARLEPGPRDA